MNALSLRRVMRETILSRTTTVSGPWWLTTSWRCEPLSLLTFFAAAKKVSAAPHRGRANRPIRKQGKANIARQPPKEHHNQTEKTARKGQHREATTEGAPQQANPNPNPNTNRKKPNPKPETLNPEATQNHQPPQAKRTPSPQAKTPFTSPDKTQSQSHHP